MLKQNNQIKCRLNAQSVQKNSESCWNGSSRARETALLLKLFPYKQEVARGHRVETAFPEQG